MHLKLFEVAGTHIFSMSAIVMVLFFVFAIIVVGYLLGKTPVFLKYEDQLMSCLMLLPVVLLVFGLAGSLVVLWKKKYGNRG